LKATLLAQFADLNETSVRYIVLSGSSLDALTSGDFVAPSSWQSAVDVVAIGGGDPGFVEAGCASLELSLPHPARANASTMNGASLFTASSLISIEASLYLPGIEAVHLDHFRPAALTAHDAHRTRRNLEHRGEQSDERCVCPPALRWRRNAHLPAVAVPSRELRP
jgi:hypothetical protein